MVTSLLKCGLRFVSEPVVCFGRFPTVCHSCCCITYSPAATLAGRFVPPSRHFSLSSPIFAKKKEKKKSTRVDEDTISQLVDVDKLKSALQHQLDSFANELIAKYSLRTAAGSLETLQVQFDGDEYPLNELAQVVRRSPSLVVVNCSAFPETVKNVLTAIQRSNMGLNPQQEGTTIFIQIPKITRDHRENLAKGVKATFIKTKDALKKIQNNKIKAIKDMENVSSDVVFDVQSQITLMTDQFVDSADRLSKTKTDELLG